jgi:glyoxylase-like metal-dependent hydrolase (beta-lactamase superfamily II)
MSNLEYTVVDLDFPVGTRNKTATIVSGESDVLLVDAGFTRADGHRLVARLLDLGKRLETVFLSHGDPDFYWGAEVIADAFPEATFVATPETIEHIQRTYEGKLDAWSHVGVNLPTRLIDIASLRGDLVLEGVHFELRGGPSVLHDRHYLWQPEDRAILGGVLLFQREHVWVADTPTPQERAAWIVLLDEMEALDPQLVVPGHRLPDAPADRTAVTGTREYLVRFEAELGAAVDGAALEKVLTDLYPDHGMRIAAQIGTKVAKGEMSWG